ncbi:class I SAM-dependent methyltransferase [Methanotorris formicicus]|uniref:Methyltransferase type 11 n=1 Tax=Methanotorris formicicus Mc-S-70 TaxID=647171 RepID=H1KYC2_9EURY|nr:class I SAM-dependent methyltransferase [Methanotorris formicicus]EHP87387.1 Methyltransferase type 11 [Methanotorris formicicus Mc-S-70]
MRLAKYYDALAKEYDKAYSFEKLKWMREVENIIISKEIKKGFFVLDVGCGSGEQLKKLNNAVGLDISIEMAKIANKKTNKLVVVGNAENLPFKNNTFDCVISFFGALNHVNLDRALKEIRRVLKKDGIFIFTVANAYDIKWILRNIKRKGIKKTIKAIRNKKGELVRFSNGRRIRVKTKFYTIKYIENALNKYNFRIKYTFGTNITNSFIDKFIYKSFLKNFGCYIGVVAKKRKI